ncbi:MAG TPA: geranylgeranylglycerol-phosphate geranylgeranyltransferase [Saprospiraceae bacterium]|nr:geranylgeranylglycerol-phosphate geranylgeranyltransferase [Saprospiraceae bacterium]HMP13129.1 geranylgeranylglycerol-phosphate geranylgeranyltransferase [Saprospiraceae bacterium]
MIALFRLIRLPNLLIVACTQLLLYYKVLLPVWQLYALQPALDAPKFHLLVAVTVLITAGGYIINDISDLRIDLINRPNRVVVGKLIAHSTSYWLYFCINLGGFLLALYLGQIAGRLSLLILFPLAVAGLLLYAAILKKRPLLGNLLVALYCAGVAGIVWIAELPVFQQLALQKAPELFMVQCVLSSYMAFAFLSTMFREIVKDLEDQPGDAAHGARTMPVAWGEHTARIIATVFGMLMLLLLLAIGWVLPGLSFISIMILIAIATLVGIGLLYLWRARTQQQYHRLSTTAKLIMLAGIMLLFFLDFI